MAKYSVTVEFTERKTREITIFARDEGEAEERAIERVEQWENVSDPEAVSVRRIAE